MRIEIATLFPEMCERVADESIIGRARRAGKLEIACINIRDYSDDRFHRVDDTPYGGGMGMVIEAEPLARCCEDAVRRNQKKPHIIYLSPKGRVFTQQKAIELSQKEYLLLVCGHYEGVDERVLEALVDEQISIGDYVLTGGELPALTLVDCVARLVPGVLSDEICFTEESHFSGLLEYPQYTRPAVWEGREVPEVLLTGHHANIAGWRHRQALERTLRRRPDMLKGAALSPEDRACLERLEAALREKAAKDDGGCEQK